MAKDPDKQALQAAAIEEIRLAVYAPRTTLPQVRRRVGQILMKLREQTGDRPEPIIVKTSERASVLEVLDRMRKREADVPSPPRSKRKRGDG
jgi:hypothetical protein